MHGNRLYTELVKLSNNSKLYSQHTPYISLHFQIIKRNNLCSVLRLVWDIIKITISCFECNFCIKYGGHKNMDIWIRVCMYSKNIRLTDIWQHMWFPSTTLYFLRATQRLCVRLYAWSPIYYQPTAPIPFDRFVKILWISTLNTRRRHFTRQSS